MAELTMIKWRDIPMQIVVRDEAGGSARRLLPDRFQEAVDAAAMADGDTSQEAYQAGFTWGPAEERPGTAAEAADAVVAEIVAAYPPERLAQRARREPNT